MLRLIKDVLHTIAVLGAIIFLGWFIWWSKTNQSPEQAQATYDQYIESSP